MRAADHPAELRNPEEYLVVYRFHSLNPNNHFFDNVVEEDRSQSPPLVRVIDPVPITGPTVRRFMTLVTTTGRRRPLTLRFDQTQISEGSGIAYATVNRGFGQGFDEYLNVEGDDTEVTVPPAVVIPAGETSVTFPIFARHDGAQDGDQSVELRVSDTIARARASITVEDID